MASARQVLRRVFLVAAPMGSPSSFWSPLAGPFNATPVGVSSLLSSAGSLLPQGLAFHAQSWLVVVLAPLCVLGVMSATRRRSAAKMSAVMDSSALSAAGRKPRGRVVSWLSSRSRAYATAATGLPRPWGVVMDLDGVVHRGEQAVAGSAEAVRLLREARVPYCFMTNGGGATEDQKAKELCALLGDAEAARAAQVLLSHTPMRALAERFRGRRVVIVGSEDTMVVAESYGFDVKGLLAVSPAQIAAGTAGIVPEKFRPAPPQGLAAVDVNAAGSPPIEAILVMFEPLDWCVDAQVLVDVLMGGRPLGKGGGRDAASGGRGDAGAGAGCGSDSGSGSGSCSGSCSSGELEGDERHLEPRSLKQPREQAAEMFASNPDFLWQAAYAVPRLGQGAFLECLRTLWFRRSGGSSLRIQLFGKPNASQFEAGRALLQENAAVAPLRRVYMVGDSPQSDVRGANGAGDPWRSILVCSGIYHGGPDSNDADNPAWRVEPDLLAAVRRLLATSDKEHLAA